MPWLDRRRRGVFRSGGAWAARQTAPRSWHAGRVAGAQRSHVVSARLAAGGQLAVEPAKVGGRAGVEPMDADQRLGGGALGLACAASCGAPSASMTRVLRNPRQPGPLAAQPQPLGLIGG